MINSLFAHTRTQDMTPKIIKQTKVLLKTAATTADGLLQQTSNFSRLQASANIIPPVSADLADWTDDDEQQPAGWEELNDEHTKNLIREKRREQRAVRQQKQKQSKMAAAAAGHSFTGGGGIGQKHS